MIKNILFPVDFSPSCVAVAPYVKRATSIFGANVTLVHVCDLASHNGFELYARAADDIAEEHWNLARSRLEVFLESEFPAKESPRILLAGDAARAITETATKSKCDLIMMPTHAGRFRRMLLGSTTANVLSDANCPVLTTQHAAAIAPPVSGTPEVGLRSRIVIGFRKVTPLRERGRVGGERKAVGRSCIQTGEADSNVEKPSKETARALQQRIVDLLRTVASDAPVSVAFGPVKQVVLDAVRKSSADVLVLGRSTHSGALGCMRDLTYSLIRDSPCPVVSV